MDKLTLLKKIKQDAKTNISIEELEIIIDSCFKILAIRFDDYENEVIDRLLHLSSKKGDNLFVKTGHKVVYPDKPFGPIPGIAEIPDIIDKPRRGNHSTDRF
jgi:hypothetical protein